MRGAEAGTSSGLGLSLAMGIHFCKGALKHPFSVRIQERLNKAVLLCLLLHESGTVLTTAFKIPCCGVVIQFDLLSCILPQPPSFSKGKVWDFT